MTYQGCDILTLGWELQQYIRLNWEENKWLQLWLEWVQLWPLFALTSFLDCFFHPSFEVPPLTHAAVPHFGFVDNPVLMTQWCFSFCWAGLAQGPSPFCLYTTPQEVRREHSWDSWAQVATGVYPRLSGVVLSISTEGRWQKQGTFGTVIFSLSGNVLFFMFSHPWIFWLLFNRTPILRIPFIPNICLPEEFKPAALSLNSN